MQNEVLAVPRQRSQARAWCLTPTGLRASCPPHGFSSLLCSCHLVPLTDRYSFAQAIPRPYSEVQQPCLPPEPFQNSFCSSRSYWNPTSSEKPFHILQSGGRFLPPTFWCITLHSQWRLSPPCLILVINIGVWLYRLMVGPWRARLLLVHLQVRHGV